MAAEFTLRFIFICATLQQTSAQKLLFLAQRSCPNLPLEAEGPYLYIPFENVSQHFRMPVSVHAAAPEPLQISQLLGLEFKLRCES